MKKKFRLNESRLRNIVMECVKNYLLNEADTEYMVPSDSEYSVDDIRACPPQVFRPNVGDQRQLKKTVRPDYPGSETRKAYDNFELPGILKADSKESTINGIIYHTIMGDLQIEFSGTDALVLPLENFKYQDPDDIMTIFQHYGITLFPTNGKFLTMPDWKQYVKNPMNESLKGKIARAKVKMKQAYNGFMEDTHDCIWDEKLARKAMYKLMSSDPQHITPIDSHYALFRDVDTRQGSQCVDFYILNNTGKTQGGPFFSLEEAYEFYKKLR